MVLSTVLTVTVRERLYCLRQAAIICSNRFLRRNMLLFLDISHLNTTHVHVWVSRRLICLFNSNGRVSCCERNVSNVKNDLKINNARNLVFYAEFTQLWRHGEQCRSFRSRPCVSSFMLWWRAFRQPCLTDLKKSWSGSACGHLDNSDRSADDWLVRLLGNHWWSKWVACGLLNYKPFYCLPLSVSWCVSLFLSLSVSVLFGSKICQIVHCVCVLVRHRGERLVANLV